MRILSHSYNKNVSESSVIRVYNWTAKVLISGIVFDVYVEYSTGYEPYKFICMLQVKRSDEDQWITAVSNPYGKRPLKSVLMFLRDLKNC